MGIEEELVNEEQAFVDNSKLFNSITLLTM